jgi:hypothetical protein
MKDIVKNSLFAFALISLGASAVGCGQLDAALAIKKDGSSETAISDETNSLIEDTVNSAGGSSEDFMHPFALDGGEETMRKSKRPTPGFLPPPSRAGHASKSPHLGRVPKKAIPADILGLLKASNEKKDAILGIDRAKVEEVLKAMRKELEDLRASKPSPEEFRAKYKAIQEKYIAQLREVLPKFDALTQEQKDSLKALHELQHGMIKSCVAPGADAASEACTQAKANLQAKIDAP